MNPTYAYAHKQCERIMSAFSDQGGFAATQAKRIIITDIKLEDVEYSGELEENVIGRNARAEVTTECIVEADCTNFGSNAHGGYICYLIDVVTALPGYCLAGAGKWIGSGVSSEMTVHFISGAPLGTKLISTAKVIMKGRTTMVVSIEIKDSNGKLIAVSTHMKSDVLSKIGNISRVKL